jgi:hypothetical protein
MKDPYHIKMIIPCPEDENFPEKTSQILTTPIHEQGSHNIGSHNMLKIQIIVKKNLRGQSTAILRYI